MRTAFALFARLLRVFRISFFSRYALRATALLCAMSRALKTSVISFIRAASSNGAQVSGCRSSSLKYRC